MFSLELDTYQSVAQEGLLRAKSYKSGLSHLEVQNEKLEARLSARVKG